MLTNRWKSKIKFITIVFTLTILITYGYHQASNLIRGPVVTIETPQNYATVDEKTVVLQGKTENITKIHLNGSPILINTEGEFRNKLPLVGHRTIIEIEAWDRFGRSTKINHYIISSLPFSFSVPSQEEINERRNEESLNEKEGGDEF